MVDILNGYFTRAGCLARYLTDTASSSTPVTKVSQINHCTLLECLLGLYAAEKRYAVNLEAAFNLLSASNAHSGRAATDAISDKIVSDDLSSTSSDTLLPSPNTHLVVLT